jgi:hypothetical protein
LYPLGAVVVGGGGGCGRGEVAVQHPSRAITLGLTEFLTPFHFVSIAAPSTNCLNSLKILYAQLIHIRRPWLFYIELIMLFSVTIWRIPSKWPKQALDIFIATPTGLLKSS